MVEFAVLGLCLTAAVAMCAIAGRRCRRTTAQMAELAKSEEQFRSLFDKAPVGIGLWRADRYLLQVNDALCEMLGHTRAELLGEGFASFGHPDDPTVRDAVLAALAAGQVPPKFYERRFRHGDGRWISCEITLVKFGDGVGDAPFLGYIQDVTARREAEAALADAQRAAHSQLERRALFDALTGAANRDLVMDRIERALARAARKFETVAVLFIDLDDFKAINDELGHAAGDFALQTVVSRLTGGIRPEDTVGRLGGDEFCVVIQVSDYYAAVELRDRLVADVEAPMPFMHNGRQVRLQVGASAGMAFGTPGMTARELIQQADDEMYRLKRTRRARDTSPRSALAG